MRQSPARPKRFPREELRLTLEKHGLPRAMHEYRKLRTLVYRYGVMLATERKSPDELAQALVAAPQIASLRVP
jgi:hypothetical protein